MTGNYIFLLSADRIIVTIVTFAMIAIFAVFLTIFLIQDYKNTKVADIREKLYKNAQRQTKYEVNTVYLDKSKNFSGTEILPVPKKEPTKEFTFEFVGWDKNYFNEAGDTIAKAIYIKKVNNIVVNFYDSDRVTLLKTFTVNYGAGITLGNFVPKKQDTNQFSFEFVGWSGDMSAFYEDTNLYAIYKATPKVYSYTFYDYDKKTVILNGTGEYGTVIPEPDMSGVRMFGHTFSHFEKYYDGILLTKNLDFYAVYNSNFEPEMLENFSENKENLANGETEVENAEKMKKDGSEQTGEMGSEQSDKPSSEQESEQGGELANEQVGEQVSVRADELGGKLGTKQGSEGENKSSVDAITPSDFSKFGDDKATSGERLKSSEGKASFNGDDMNLNDVAKLIYDMANSSDDASSDDAKKLIDDLVNPSDDVNFDKKENSSENETEGKLLKNNPETKDVKGKKKVVSFGENNFNKVTKTEPSPRRGRKRKNDGMFFNGLKDNETEGINQEASSEEKNHSYEKKANKRGKAFVNMVENTNGSGNAFVNLAENTNGSGKAFVDFGGTKNGKKDTFVDFEGKADDKESKITDSRETEKSVLDGNDAVIATNSHNRIDDIKEDFSEYKDGVLIQPDDFVEKFSDSYDENYAGNDNMATGDVSFKASKSVGNLISQEIHYDIPKKTPKKKEVKDNPKKVEKVTVKKDGATIEIIKDDFDAKNKDRKSRTKKTGNVYSGDFSNEKINIVMNDTKRKKKLEEDAEKEKKSREDDFLIPNISVMKASMKTSKARERTLNQNVTIDKTQRMIKIHDNNSSGVTEEKTNDEFDFPVAILVGHKNKR